jgi:hypothetical protein
VPHAGFGNDGQEHTTGAQAQAEVGVLEVEEEVLVEALDGAEVVAMDEQ